MLNSSVPPSVPSVPRAKKGPQNSEERGAPPRGPALSIHPAPVVEAVNQKFLFCEVHLRVYPSLFWSFGGTDG